MLVGSIKNQVRVFVHEFLHGVLDEFIEGVELLTDETLCIEEARDDRPTVLLCYLCIVLVIFIVLHFASGVWVSTLIVGVRILNRNEINRVRRHVDASDDQYYYTPWLIRAISEPGGSTTTLKKMVLVFFPGSEYTLRIGHRAVTTCGRDAEDRWVWEQDTTDRADCTSIFAVTLGPP